jgi:cytochrome c556
MNRLQHPLSTAAALGVLLLSIVVRAQQPAPASPPKPLVPLAASTLAEGPEPYFGQLVTVTGAVEQTLSPSVFSIDQDKTRSTGKHVLVVAPTLIGAVDLNAYVTVIGEVIRFEPAEIAQKLPDYSLDLPPAVIATYRGGPAVLATAVLNTAMIDLARRPPPPLTAEEEAYDKVMKRVGPAFAALREALTATDAAAVKQHAEIMRQAFGETAAFWKGRGRTDATGWATDARSHVEALVRAAAASDWDAAQTSASSLGQTCQSCHGAYRERLDDGSYRIKAVTK